MSPSADQTLTAGAPMNVQTLVVKVASRCNLNCSYCYVYNQGDDTWKSQPRVMPAHVVAALMDRVKAHCLRHKMTDFALVMHGGEPLLTGQAFVRSFVAEARRRLLPEVQPHIFLQTNGTLLTRKWSRLLLELGVAVGVSLDGTPAINDRYRVDHAGRGSYAAVRAGIENFRAVAGRPPGILSVISQEADPRECYEHLKSLGARSVDFLFPDATYQRPPVGQECEQAPVGDWLARLFDCWFHDDRPTIRIRLFVDLISMLCGGKASTDGGLGTGLKNVLVVDCDGSVEPIDGLKLCGNGFTKVGTNLLSHELDEALSTDLARRYYLSGRILCQTCQDCSIKQVCGGGELPHRYSRERGFDNPSVYCPDLTRIITHVESAIAAAMPTSLRTRLQLPSSPAGWRAPVRPLRRPARVALPVLP
jgi:uncharacterized protein